MNEFEGAFAKAATKMGWKVLRNGWPDFLIYKNGAREWWSRDDPDRISHCIAVELKRGGDRVSAEQAEMHRVLKHVGVPVMVCGPEFLEALKSRSGKRVADSTYTLQELIRANLELESRVHELSTAVENMKKALDASVPLMSEIVEEP